ncbi:MAG TPA: 5-bromo-4-chloroindolyl phosphate hydrolysis family protein [Vicinamibacterales bacterium]|nr:5-bromo-4-chloroindolyl phosphate hydrolysis family protein [Vicinamibacterales bacterium]
MSLMVRRWFARAALAKPAALFLLPLPLLIAIVAALVAGDLDRLALTGGALASFWSAGVLATRGLVEEVHYRLGERLLPAAFPWKRLSALPTALGSGLAATSGGHDPAGALAFAVLAGLGHLAFIGTDPARQRLVVRPMDGVDGAEVGRQLEQAHGHIRALLGAGRSLALPEFRDRVGRIVHTGQAVLAEIERNPVVAPRARRFLNLYLDEAERVTAEYARTKTGGGDGSLERNFRQLLIEMETTFSEQHRLVLERRELLLDADIEVLNARLTKEGPG